MAEAAETLSRLSPRQVERFRAEGHLTPLPGVPAAQALGCVRRLANLGPAQGCRLR